MLGTKTKKASFEDLVAEAVAVEDEFSAATASRKLTARAFLAEALRLADSTRGKLDAIREQLAARGERFPAVQMFIKKATKWVCEASCPRPPRELRRLSWLGGADLPAELAVLGSHVLEVFAFAVLVAGERHGEDFGDVEDLGAYDRRVEELRARRAELQRRIGTEYTPADLLIGAVERDGRSVISLKVSGGAVQLAPAESLGERLVNFIMTQPTIEQALRSNGGR